MLDWIDVNHKDEKDYYLEIPIVRHCDRDSLTQAHKAIDHITQNYPAPYVLYLSGGVDSQAMLWAWHTSGRDFLPVSWVYNRDMNAHDLNCGMPALAGKCGVKIEYRDIDILEFYNNDYKKYRETYRCGSPQICAYMYMADQQHEGTVIFSGSLDGPDKFYTKNEWDLYHYAIKSKKNLVPFFFSETQSLHCTVKQLGKDKSEKYQSNGYPVRSQKTKLNGRAFGRFSGFEKIKDFYDQSMSHLITPKLKLTRQYKQNSARAYDVLLRNSFEFQYRNDKYIVKIIEQKECDK